MNTLYLCKPNGVILGTMSGLREDTVRLKQQMGSPWELTFEVARYVMRNEQFEETSYYNSIAEMMELFLDCEDIKIKFQINGTPTINNDGIREIKSVVARSVECELQDKFLKGIQINTGAVSSQENLVVGDISGNPVDPYDTTIEVYDYNTNPYTKLPVDYITVHNTMAEDLRKILQDIQSNRIVWKNITYRISLTYSTGEITSPTSGFTQAVSELLNIYPRLGCNIIWGIDKRNNSKTLDTIVPVTQGYLVIRDDRVFIAPQAYTFRTVNNVRQIMDNNQGSYSMSILTSGITDLISYYEKFGNQLSMIQLCLEKANATGWTVGDIPEDVKRKYFSFNVESQDIFSFFTQTCAKSMKVLFDFDRLYKKVNIIDIANTDEEHDTGVIISFKNLMKTVDMKASSEDGIKTKFKPTGANNLGITYVNFGEEYITNLDYFMNKVNEYGELQYCDNNLRQKYFDWKNYREGKSITISSIPTYEYSLYDKRITSRRTVSQTYESRRLAFMDLTKRYNQATMDYDSINLLLPNDGCSIDYTTFPFDDLVVAWKAYQNALDTLLELYKEDYNVKTISDNFEETYEAWTVDGELAKDIRETMYWHDYAAYVYTIIPNVENALKIYVYTDADGYFTSRSKDENGEWVQYEGGNPHYNGNAELVTENISDAFLYDMSLYGSSELDAKRQAWSEVAAQIYKEGFGKPTDPFSSSSIYNDENGWNRLTPDEQAGFTSEDNFKKQIGKYLDYVSLVVRDNSLTHKRTKGVIQMAIEAKAQCDATLEVIKSIQETLDTKRKELAEKVLFENWVGDNGKKFSTDELAVLYLLTREADYNNSNILITNLDDIVSTVDTEEELYQDAQKKLFEKSRPQYSFSISLDNLLAIPEFQAWKSSISLLNYIYVQMGLFDNLSTRLRIVIIESNPIIPTADINLGFSNLVYTYDGFSDLDFLLGEALGGSATSISSAGSSSSGGVYGTNDAEITIANNMLNALLKLNGYPRNWETEIAKSQKETTDALRYGNVAISGKCITDTINSYNYNGTNNQINNSQGSIIKLYDGTFNFGGGRLVWDGEMLSVRGNVIAGIIKSTDETTTVINLNDGSFSIANGGIVYEDGELTIRGVVTEDQLSGIYATKLGLSNGTISVNAKGLTGSIDNNGNQFSFSDGKFSLANGKLVWNGSSLTSTVFTSESDVKSIVQNEGYVKSSSLSDYATFTKLADTTTDKKVYGGKVKKGSIVSEDNKLSLNLDDSSFALANNNLTWDKSNLIITNPQINTSAKYYRFSDNSQYTFLAEDSTGGIDIGNVSNTKNSQTAYIRFDGNTIYLKGANIVLDGNVTYSGTMAHS